MNKAWALKQKGFTIVELLIVIVIIGILAAIVIVAYNGVQARARDTARKSDLAQLAKAIQLYHVDNGDYAESGCGSGSGSGWLVSDYDGAGPLIPINQCLLNGRYLSRVLTDPSGSSSCAGLTCHAYMKASCGASGTYLLANLETLPQTSTDSDGTCYPAWDTTYGVNYVIKVN